MKTSEEHYTLIFFLGVKTSPLRLQLRKVTLRRALLTAVALIVLQMGILSHYAIQISQISELNTLRKEIMETRGQTKTFSSSIDDMKKRMLVMRALNRKLQTMFGLEPDTMEDIEVNGQGGEEFPYESVAYGESNHAFDVSSKGQITPKQESKQASLVVNIELGLAWLDRQASKERQILDGLAETVDERAARWAATPSIWPVKGPITSKFGPRISPFTGKKAFHSGLDIGSPQGRKIKASASGKVVVTSYETRMGNFIRINHGYGIATTYGHLSKRLVKYGQKVNRGDVIGLIGSTGKFSTGPHLHYQVTVNDKAVNPIQYILD